MTDNTHTTNKATRVGSHQRLVLRLGGLTIAMFAFGYALVPLFDIFCEIAGIGGKTEQISTQQAAKLGIDRDRTVTVEFTGNTALGLPWQFATNQRTLKVHPGEVSIATYRAENTASRPVTGLAKFSVTPIRAAKYLNKTECFCFSNQELQAGEAKNMPLRFVIDPALPSDVKTITLSYTFFNADKYAEKSVSNRQETLVTTRSVTKNDDVVVVTARQQDASTSSGEHRS